MRTRHPVSTVDSLLILCAGIGHPIDPDQPCDAEEQACSARAERRGGLGQSHSGVAVDEVLVRRRCDVGGTQPQEAPLIDDSSVLTF